MLKVNKTETLQVKPNVSQEVLDELFSLETMQIFKWIALAVVCQAIDVFGIITNIINIICFTKQGFKDPVNISLLGLAVSDLGCLTTLIWTNIAFTPAFSELDLPFDATESQFLIGIIPHTTFTRITGWITALITLERCLCITAPLKVSQIVTPKRVSVIVISIFLIFIISVSPVYFVIKLGTKFFPARNKTLVGLVVTKDRVPVEKANYTINNILIPFSSFLVIIVCTLVLVIKLHKQTKWRKASTACTKDDSVTRRNLKVAKMIVMISILFIVCFVPIIILFVAMSTDTRFSIDGQYKNALILFGGVGVVLESINSSSNIFIYYHMSSNYRTVFQRLFRREGKSY